MSVTHALLGFLDLSPMTGYDLKRSMDESTQAFWHASLSQIYPALQRMQAEGLVESETHPQEGKPDKRVYRITGAGRSALTEWLEEPVRTLEPGKSTALLKLFFSGRLAPDRILRHLRIQLDLHQEELVRLRDVIAPAVARHVADAGLTREGRMWELVRELGERCEATYVAWLEHAIQEIETRA